MSFASRPIVLFMKVTWTVIQCNLTMIADDRTLEWSSPQIELEGALVDCSAGLELFLNNRFSDALAHLKPWWVPYFNVGLRLTMDK